MHFSGGTYHEPRAAGHFMAGLPQTSLGQVRLPSQSSQVSNSSICTPPATRGLASPEISPQVVSSQSLARIPSEDGWGNGGPYTQEQLGTPPPLTPSTVRYSLTATEMPTPVNAQPEPAALNVPPHPATHGSVPHPAAPPTGTPATHGDVPYPAAPPTGTPAAHGDVTDPAAPQTCTPATHGVVPDPAAPQTGTPATHGVVPDPAAPQTGTPKHDGKCVPNPATSGGAAPAEELTDMSGNKNSAPQHTTSPAKSAKQASSEKTAAKDANANKPATPEPIELTSAEAPNCPEHNKAAPGEASAVPAKASTTEPGTAHTAQASTQNKGHDAKNMQVAVPKKPYLGGQYWKTLFFAI